MDGIITWSTDTTIGYLDSIGSVDFDIHNNAGNLFAALRFRESDEHYCGAYFSSDTGLT